MASEYLKRKYRDVKPDAPLVLSKAERRRNWWHYHKWHVGAAAALLAIAGSIAWNALSRVEPDYTVAYVGTNVLPDNTAAALESALAGLGEDLNGDGKTVVSLRQYASGGADAGTGAAAGVQLMADIIEGESYFFLLEDPEQFQRTYCSLCLLDGTLPEEGDSSAAGTYLAWSACPVLSGLELGRYAYMAAGQAVSGDSQELLSRLFIARRGFRTEKSAPYPEGCAALWSRLTEGAVS